MQKLRSRTLLGLITAVATLALTSCYRFDTNVNINNDGSGTLSYVLAFNYDAFAQFDDSESLESREEFCQEAQADQSSVPEGATVEPYDQDGYCGVKVTVEIPANDNFGDALLDATEGDQDGLQDFSIEKQADNQWTFTQSFEGTELESLSEDPPANDTELALLQSTLQISYSITLPGSPGTHNADSATEEGGKTTFTWNVDPYTNLETLEAATVSSGDGDDATSTTGTPTTEAPASTEGGDEEDDASSDDDSTSADQEDEEATETSEVDLGFVDSPKPDGAVDDGSSSRTALVAGLFGILAVLAAIFVLVLKWPIATKSNSSGPPSPPAGGPPTGGPPPPPGY